MSTHLTIELPVGEFDFCCNVSGPKDHICHACLENIDYYAQEVLEKALRDLETSLSGFMKKSITIKES